MSARSTIQHADRIAPLVILPVSGAAIRRGHKRLVILRVHRTGDEESHNKCRQAHEPNACKSSPADRFHVSLPPDCGPH
jgi:hypothetical protein